MISLGKEWLVLLHFVNLGPFPDLTVFLFMIFTLSSYPWFSKSRYPDQHQRHHLGTCYRHGFGTRRLIEGENSGAGAQRAAVAALQLILIHSTIREPSWREPTCTSDNHFHLLFPVHQVQEVWIWFSLWFKLQNFLEFHVKLCHLHMLKITFFVRILSEHYFTRCL